MRQLDDLRAAGDAARTRVDEARRALSETRDAVGGGRARRPKEAQEHLAALRGAIETDLGALRDRVRAADAEGPGLRAGVAAGAVGLVGLVGAGLLAARAVRRGSERRAEDRRAAALAAALARRDEIVTRLGRRGPGVAAALLGIAAVAGAAVLATRRAQAPSDDEVWG
jgi:hypothetical protein